MKRRRVSARVRRRRLFASIVALACLVALAYFVWPSGGGHPSAASAVVPTTIAQPVSLIAAENARPGSASWHIPPTASHTVQGYADRVSAQPGETVTLYVSTAAPMFRVDAYRMGWYQGIGARLVWSAPTVPGQVQNPPTRLPETRTVTTKWKPSLKVVLTPDFVPGDYLLKLTAGTGQSYIPLTVRDDAGTAPVLVMNAVTTWQAYNAWGGYSLYNGPLDDPELRSQIVSFDRPYNGFGADEFIGNELGVVATVERMGLDVSYTTDVDVHAHPERVLQHRVLVSLGHDEYWSPEMRAAVTAARDHGVNLMFLGANAVFRRIRLEPSPLGPNRLEVNYRVAADDPMNGVDNTRVTTNWREEPDPRPESSLTGLVYECNPVDVTGVVADAPDWVFAGSGLKKGSKIPHLIGTEFDRVNLQSPTPHQIQVLFHSPLQCRGQATFADAALYTVSSGADVFDTGTGAWVCRLFIGCPRDPPPRPDPKIIRVTENVLRVFAAGPAGRSHPAQPNVGSLGTTDTGGTNPASEESVPNG